MRLRLFYTHWILLLCMVILLATSDTVAQGVRPPDDRFYDKQWALEKISASCGWQVTTGTSEVTVAVLDTGVDLHHPDLVSQVRDDGYDFVEDDADPGDKNGHGTHVAGIIAAAMNNAEGIVGLAPDVRILPVRVMSAEGSGKDAWIAQGIRFAVQRGAKVINLSLGATLFLATPGTAPIIAKAIREAQAAGALVVLAAGNDFVPLPNALLVEAGDVLVVAASTPDDRKARFSNSGPWVDVAAPGEDILSTMPTYEVYLTSQALPVNERFKQDYDYMSGTSMAAPYVSALAALLFAAHPDWTATQVQQHIKETADERIYDNSPRLRRLRLVGAGRIDACRALSEPIAGVVSPTAPPRATTPPTSPTTPPPVSSPRAPSADTSTPVQTVSAFVDALEDGNLEAALDLVEPGEARDLLRPRLRSYRRLADNLTFENPTYTEIDNDGSLAHVEVICTLHYVIRRITVLEREMNTTFTVVNSENTWYIRSPDLPNLDELR